MNITEYVRQPFDRALYRGKMSIKEGHTIANANEALYKYIGKNSIKSIKYVIHPDDLEEFEDALVKMEEEPQVLFIRILCFEKEYRMMYVSMRYNGRILNGFRSYDVELFEVMRSVERLVHNAELVKKYRAIMSYSDKYYFDYDYEEERLAVFNYWNGMYNNQVYKKSVQELKEAYKNGNFTREQFIRFDVFCESLEKRMDNIDLNLDGEFLGIPGKMLKIRGGNIIKHDSKVQLVGIITAFDKDGFSDTGKYYLSTAAIDRATGVFNKRAIEELVKENLIAYDGKQIYFAILDLDEFKLFNDTYGHLVGDKIISVLAQIMRTTVGNRGYVGRFGGDEFIIMTYGVENDEDFIYILKAIRKNLAWHFSKMFPDTPVTLSVGIARSPLDGNLYEELFEKADKSLYLAKERGRNRFIIYTEAVKQTVKEDANRELGLKTRLSDDRYKVGGIITKTIENVKAKQGSKEAIEEAFGIVRDAFDVDFVAMFSLKDYKSIVMVSRVEIIGKSLNEAIIGEVKDNLDDYGNFIVNKIVQIKEDCPNTYSFLQEVGVLGYILVMKDDYICIAGVKKRLRKWSDSDKGFITMFLRLVTEYIKF